MASRNSPANRDEVSATWKGLTLKGLGEAAPTFGVFIASVVISFGLLIFGPNYVPWLAAIITIVILHVVSGLIFLAWYRINTQRRNGD